MNRLRSLAAVSALTLASSTAQAATPVLAAAAEIGITPETLVLADLQTHATSILAEIETEENLRFLLEATHQLADQAAAEATALRQQVVAGNDDPDLIATYESRLAELQGHQLQIASFRSSLMAAATAGMPAAQLESLATCSGASHQRVPREFRVVARTDAQWKQIGRALRAERRALRRGTALAPEHAAVLNDLRANPQVTAATVRLDLHLQAVEQVFAGFAEPEQQ